MMTTFAICTIFLMISRGVSSCGFNYTWFTYGGKMYGIAKDMATILDIARWCCQKEGSNVRLTIFQSSDDVTGLMTYIQATFGGRATQLWVDMKRDPRYHVFKWADGRSVDSKLWAADEPQADELCARFVVAAKTLYGRACEDYYGVFCQAYPSAGSICTLSLSWASVADVLYGFSSSTTDFETARSCCEAYGKKFRLAVFDEVNTADGTLQALKGSIGSRNTYWVDAFRLNFDTSKDFRWANGYPVSPSQWSTGGTNTEPGTEDTAAILVTSYTVPLLQGVDKVAKYRVLCQERTLGEIMPVPITEKSLVKTTSFDGSYSTQTLASHSIEKILMTSSGLLGRALIRSELSTEPDISTRTILHPSLAIVPSSTQTIPHSTLSIAASSTRTILHPSLAFAPNSTQTILHPSLAIEPRSTQTIPHLTLSIAASSTRTILHPSLAIAANSTQTILHPSMAILPSSTQTILHPSMAIAANSTQTILHLSLAFAPNSTQTILHPSLAILPSSTQNILHPSMVIAANSTQTILHPSVAIAANSTQTILHPSLAILPSSTQTILYPSMAIAANSTQTILYPSLAIAANSTQTILHPSLAIAANSTQTILHPSMAILPSSTQTILHPSMAIAANSTQTILHPSLAIVANSTQTILHPSLAIAANSTQIILHPSLAIAANSTQTILHPSLAIAANSTQTILHPSLAIAPSSTPASMSTAQDIFEKGWRSVMTSASESTDTYSATEWTHGSDWLSSKTSSIDDPMLMTQSVEDVTTVGQISAADSSFNYTTARSTLHSADYTATVSAVFDGSETLAQSASFVSLHTDIVVNDHTTVLDSTNVESTAGKTTTLHSADYTATVSAVFDGSETLAQSASIVSLHIDFTTIVDSTSVESTAGNTIVGPGSISLDNIAESAALVVKSTSDNFINRDVTTAKHMNHHYLSTVPSWYVTSENTLSGRISNSYSTLPTGDKSKQSQAAVHLVTTVTAFPLLDLSNGSQACRFCCGNLSVEGDEYFIDIQRELYYIRMNLLLDRARLSKTLRKKYSIYDNRLSSRIIGSVGISFLVLSFVLIVLMDMERVLQRCYEYKE